MQQIFEEVVNKIVETDPRYQRDAYLFIREALEFTQKKAAKRVKGRSRHISGKELLDGIREYALLQFGPMTVTVFQEWGIKSCNDFGEIVFLMVEYNLLSKTEKDSREDFKEGYSFEEAFIAPFRPSGGKKRENETKTVESEV